MDSKLDGWWIDNFFPDRWNNVTVENGNYYFQLCKWGGWPIGTQWLTDCHSVFSSGMISVQMVLASFFFVQLMSAALSLSSHFSHCKGETTSLAVVTGLVGGLSQGWPNFFGWDPHPEKWMGHFKTCQLFWNTPKPGKKAIMYCLCYSSAFCSRG